MKRRKSKDDPPGSPQVSPDVGVKLLREQIQSGRKLLDARPINSDDYSAWELKTRNFLEKAFGVGSPNVSSVMDVGLISVFPMDAGERWWEQHHHDSLQTQLKKLGTLVELLETEVQLTRGEPALAAPKPSGHRIFLVHGHDDGLLHEVARFLERLEQDVLVLREQPNKGRTIIEKFEDYADVGFAIVLLTPDDRGGERDLPFENQQPRPRQNVVLELGYFLGRLGRARVCTLYREGTEIPSDYTGVLYVPVDSAGAWRLTVARELKAAGLPADLNLAV